ncbi:penicillin-binding protein 2 [Angustibacter sp. Root456]|uniref:penicillin-binding protein 2 n=1 Tax=Angustibacter sp. Root456 TaxID=1736539 RepID=UPI0009EADCBB|nr:penicillin-binding protein 2 [Angustibacter sp. Root456]
MKSNVRLLAVAVFVLSLMVTLVARLFTVQVVGADGYRAAAATNREREIITPAVRGLVLDDRGRPLISNRSALVVSVSRTELLNSDDEGRALLHRLADVLGLPFETVWGRTQLCGTPGAPKAPVCFNGAPYQPVPVAEDVPARVALQIMERSEDFPGVSAELQAVRTIPEPFGVQAAHLLGYLGPVTDEELKASSQAARDGRTELQRTDRVGRAGLEAQYDTALRGTPGVTTVGVDIRGRVTGTLSQVDPDAGNHLVTSIDAKVQAATERALRDGIRAARTRQDPGGRGRLKADSGAAVVMDVRTGQIVAMASWPSYDPRVWLGGITDRELARLSDEKAGTPLVSRATQGLFPPASTFKVVSLPAAVQHGFDLHGTYDCGSSYQVGNRAFHNYESEAYGRIDLHKAIVVSCDTIFYQFAYKTWLRLGGSKAKSDARDPFVNMATAFGLGKPTGIDLPGDSAGRIPDRAWKQSYWESTKDYYCGKARTGFPEVAGKDPSRARFLTQLAKENCADGNVFRAGDEANFSIGQGDVSVTPLQMVRVYAAIANGGTLWTPHVGKAVVSPSGKVVQRIAPHAAAKVPVRPDVLKFLRSALRGVVTSGTGRGAFAGFPVAVAGKTGTGEVYGKQATAWFSSFAPADHPQYAVSVVVSQGGTGASTAAPIVRAIYAAIYGVRGSKIVPSAAALPGGRPPASLPRIRPDGTIVTPEGVVPATEGLPDPRGRR